MRDFSIHDVRFQRSAGDECAIIVFGRTVGSVQLCPDASDPERPASYSIALFDSENPARRVERRTQVRLAIADWLWEERLVPVEPPVPALPIKIRAAA